MLERRIFALLLIALLSSACAPTSDASEDSGAWSCPKCDTYASDAMFITVAFDGSRSISMWRDSMRFAKEIERDFGKPLRYTYFINTPYYLPDPPPNALGISRGEIPAELNEMLMRFSAEATYFYESCDEIATDLRAIVELI